MQRTTATSGLVLPQGAEIYNRIVRHARVATGASLVILTTWDPASGMARSEAISGYGTAAAKRALSAIERLFPGFDPETVAMSGRANPHLETVFFRGEATSGPFTDVAEGVVPGPVLTIAAKFLKLSFSSVYPLVVQGQIVGSLSFHGPRKPDAATRSAYGAFASQVSLTLENAILLQTLKGQVQDLRQARKLVRTGSEALRQNIAETLHGPVQTQLLVADFNLRRAVDLVDECPVEAKAIIEEARLRIDSVREREIRAVSHALHPSVIKLGLGPALRSLADQYGSSMQVHVDLDRRLDGVGTQAAIDLGAETRLTAYRQVEEALANARKHGNATQVWVTAAIEESQLVIEVADNGDGFDAAMEESGLGLQMVAMLVDEADGRWSLTNNAGGGALFRSSMPVVLGQVVLRAADSHPIPELPQVLSA